MSASPLRFVGLILVGIAPWSVMTLAQDKPLHLPRQPGNYTPLDHRVPPGKVAHWNLIAKPALANYFQPVRVTLPSQGLVSFYAPDQAQPVLTQAPAQASMLIGPVYRLKVSGLPEYPGVELYPTIELTDRLHPPTGREQEFPIPVEISREEIESALRDQMVTKVIYLEQPRLASAIDVNRGETLTYDVPAHSNLLDTAYQLGRPVAILRLGGRLPDERNPHDPLFTQRAPLQIAPHSPNP